MAVIWPEEESPLCWNGPYLTTKGAAKALGVAPGTLRKYARDKRYPSPIKRRRGAGFFYLFSREKVLEIEAKIRELRRR